MATPLGLLGSASSAPPSSPGSSFLRCREAPAALARPQSAPDSWACSRRPVGVASLLSSPFRAAAALTMAAAVASQAPSLTALLSSMCTQFAPAPVAPLAFSHPFPAACLPSTSKPGASHPLSHGVPTTFLASPTCAASPLSLSSILQQPAGRGGPLASPSAWQGRLFSVMPAATLALADQAEKPESLRHSADASPSHPAFDITSQEAVPELHLTATEYVHKKTGARVMSLTVPENETEKVFCICLRTPVADSTGVPHILEHSVLSGSNKYPLKEPFAELLKGSMYSYLNASTYPDRTCYPVASVNDKDFYNLADVYFDAVFQPRAIRDETVLLQEGWRLEVTSEDAKAEGDAVRLRGDGELDESRKRKRKLAFQGVVLNEMRGVYSSPEALLWKAQMETLFPDIPSYAHDSGGDPQDIKTLTFDAFKEFYNRFYHPSNAKIFFWGSDDVMRRLDFVDKNLEALEVPKTCNRAIEASSVVPSQPLLPAPTRVTRVFPAPKEQLEDLVTVNLVLDPMGFPVPTPFQRLSLTILSHLLMGTSASPLYRALTESGLGKQVIGGIEDGLKHLLFSAGLKGVPQQSEGGTSAVDKIEEIVLECLEKHAREGFTDEAIDASINSTEFRLREFNTGSFPKGLAVIQEMTAGWTEDRDPVDGLRFEGHLEELRRRLKSGEPLFENLLRNYLRSGLLSALCSAASARHFIGNTHRATIHLRADPDEEARREAKDKEEIEEVEASLSSEELDALETQTIELKAKQMAEDPPEALRTLPTLTLQDVDAEGEEIPTTIESYLDGRAALLRHALPTAGILYVDLAFPLHTLTLDELRYLALFGRLLVEAGTSTKDEAAIVHHIGRYTGGISSVTDIRTLHPNPREIADPYQSAGYFIIKGKALKSRIPELFSTIAEIMTDANLGNGRRGKEILKETLSSLEAAFLHSGHAMASSRILASLTVTGYISEQRHGHAYLEFIKDLKKQADEDWSPIQEKLVTIREKLLKAQREQLLINLTGDETTLEAATSPAHAGGRALAEAVQALRTGASSHHACLDGKRGVHPCPWGAELKKKHGLLQVKEEGTVGEGFVVPTRVNYVGLGGRLFAPGEPYVGASAVAVRALSTGYIWDNIRVVGGAYGSFFRSDFTGTFLFTSYRDPHLRDTLKRYLGAGAGLHQFAENLDERSLTRAVIGVLRDLDQPTPNDQKGYRALWQTIQGETKEDRQRFRKEVLQTTAADIRAFADRLEAQLGGEARRRQLEEGSLLERERVAASSLSADEALKTPSLVSVVVGSKTAFDEASRQDPAIVYKMKRVMGDGAADPEDSA
ncbi:Mitochondrial presequence protease (Precursor), related [Neospora caninum Liverpool]|uniref:Mitochondrial presequence protease (Precursor), related n=1 Tax=Neospora caninum (strain Liverpool) TaxID=572307 RepID=F0VLI5_NEOCL|nr:Mitochondrial presequence protease (Precursor), related [Neospora caninum Liverpool]CBZ54113.1 Mitochondrial presequence protease (Precursor), related [Neospora caninum Liverpool]CEL68812.1 TPA: Mitochondrial presequence protease (Precursor), related [Neospora caninum Liverpool]|eukprot:XP_003884144.1 Mitochondrial presequence protease (Precursor), related [Neospora caninum Liverpool]